MADTERKEGVHWGGWAVAYLSLWFVLGSMAEIPATSDFAQALALAIALGVTGAYGPQALDEVNRFIGKA